MIKRQRIVVFLLGLGLGYAIHDPAYDVGLKFLNSIHIVSTTSSQQRVLGNTSESEFVTNVTYNGIRFSTRKVHTRKGNYIKITNTSKTAQMWLQSDMLGVTTNRGYGEGEQFQFTAEYIGTFIISDKLRPEATFQLIVEE